MENVQEKLEQARLLERSGQSAAAMRRYVDLADREGSHQNDPAFWTRLGRLQQDAREDEAAADSYGRAVELLVRADQGNSALALCDRILRVDPARHEVLRRKAEIALHQGLPVDAREALAAFADRAAERGEHEDALDLFRRFRERFPRDAEGRRSLIEALRRAGEEGEAVQELRGLWSLLQRDGHTAEAEAVRAEILDLDPEADPDLAPVEPEEIPREDDLPVLGAEADAPESAPAPGLQPTSLADAPLADPFANKPPVQGLEPTAVQPEAAGPNLPLMDDLPGSTDAPEPALEEPAQPEAEAAASEQAAGPPPGARPASPPEREYVDLGALVLSDDEEEDTRFRVAREDPSGDEDQDFADILALFRQQVSEHIAPDDTASHYDLGLAFKDMGLLDDAIGQLQLALRAGANPLATLEVMGECFLEKNEPSLAARVLTRATRLRDTSDVEMVGVHYLLGRCEEVLGHPGEARGCYERVVAVDIGFRDAAARLDALRDGSD